MGSEGEWTPLLEDLLRGLVHAMNNRVTALSAFAELAALDDDTLEIGMLRQEIHRLHAVSSLVSVLASRNDELEALEVSAVLEMALEIHSHHPRMRAVPCTVEKAGSILPVRVPRWALLRLVLLMVDAAKRAGGESDATTVALWLSGNDAVVRLHFMSREPLGIDAADLARRCGAAVSYAKGEAILELPSLLDLRRREKARE